MKKIMCTSWLLVAMNMITSAQLPSSFTARISQVNSFNTQNINTVLSIVGAEFIQPVDSLTASFFGDKDFDKNYKKRPRNKMNQAGLLDNEYTLRKRLVFSYEVHPLRYTTPLFWLDSLIDKRLIGIFNPDVKDSLRNLLYLADYKRIINMDTLWSGKKCDLERLNVGVGLLKSKLNADSVIFFKSLVPWAKNCSIGIVKGYILYKKNYGYIVVSTKTAGSDNINMPMDQVSVLLDKLLESTWGSFRFKNK